MYLGAICLLFSIGAIKTPDAAAIIPETSSGDWVILEDGNSLLPHKIIRKTIFVAPKKTGCPTGYQWSSQRSKCLQSVQLNRKAQFEFYLQKLNAGTVGKPKKDEGPLYVSLSFNEESSSENETVEKNLIPKKFNEKSIKEIKEKEKNQLTTFSTKSLPATPNLAKSTTDKSGINVE